MSVILDACAIPAVFNPTHKNHDSFKLLLRWINAHKVFIVYGGEKLTTELRDMTMYWDILVELERLGQVAAVCYAQVEVHSGRISKKVGKKLDDPHLIAVAIVAECGIICTLEVKNNPYLKERASILVK